MNAQHSCASADWGTPTEWIERVRSVMGQIDLDPASSEEHNQLVGARHFYTEKENALAGKTWTGRVFLNPPGGQRRPQQFFEKLYLHFMAGEVSEFIYLGYSLEQLLWIGRKYHLPASAVVSIPHKRIRFRGAGSSPTHGNFFLYCGPFKGVFRKVFADHGLLLNA